MHEDRCSMLWKDNVGLPRQVFSVQAEPEAHRVKHRAHAQFRLCIRAFDRSHVPAALLRRVNVRHRYGAPAAASRSLTMVVKSDRLSSDRR